MQGCFKQFCEQKEWKIVMQNASLMPCLGLQYCGARLHHLTTNEIATKKSTHHQLITLKQLTHFNT